MTTAQLRTLVAATLALGAAACVQVAPAAAETPFVGQGNTPSFGLPATLDNQGARSTGVAIGDLNGDGKADLATAVRSEGLAVFLATGGGHFAPVTKYPAPVGPTTSDPFTISVVIADVNGDGKPDVVGETSVDDAAVVWLGTGGGAFAPGAMVGLDAAPGCGTPGSRTCAANFPFDVVVADFNEDGKPDLATANGNSDNASVVPGNGDGTFGYATILQTNDFPQGIASADVNKDGHADLVVTNAFSHNISLFLGHGDGSFGAASTVGIGTGRFPGDVTIADFNQDGNLDLASANLTQSSSVLFGDGAGGFGTAQIVELPDNGSSVVPTDVNGDGYPDLTLYGGTLTVLAGDGSGGFGDPVALGAGEGSGDGPSSVAVGDLDGDGRPDIATANSASGEPGFTDDVSVWPNTTPQPAPFTANLGAHVPGFLRLTGGSADFGAITPASSFVEYHATAHLAVRTTSPGVTVYVTQANPAGGSLAHLGDLHVQPIDQDGNFATFVVPHPVFSSPTAVNLDDVPVKYMLRVYGSQTGGPTLTKGAVYNEPIVYTATSPLP